jgi:hypothetical protein
VTLRGVQTEVDLRQNEKGKAGDDWCTDANVCSQWEEDGVVAFHRLIGVAAVSFAAFALASGPAAAAKKMTYEQAYEKCKTELAGKTQPTALSVSAATVGGGCMKKYGHRLKK